MSWRLFTAKPSRRRINLAAIAAAALLLGAWPATDRARADGELPAVLELFTSQGCSSCPPADKLLGDLKNREGIIALSLPVDYWDYLGWKDTFASPANTQRQRAYARALGRRGPYTPQVVVNGMTDAVGGDRAGIQEAITTARAQLAAHHVPITVMNGGMVVQVAGSGSEKYHDGTLWLVLYSAAKPVRIERGENAQRTVIYHNVVRDMSPVGVWRGKPMRVELPGKDIKNRGYDGGVILLQAGPAGPILGAARLAGK